MEQSEAMIRPKIENVSAFGMSIYERDTICLQSSNVFLPKTKYGPAITAGPHS